MLGPFGKCQDGVVQAVPGCHRGRLLVATPPLGDPNFDRSVVLLLEHTEEGAVGVVLNRPGARRVADIVPGWATLAAAPAVVFQGGPVEPGAIIGLGRRAPDGDTVGWSEVVGRVGTIDLMKDPE